MSSFEKCLEVLAIKSFQWMFETSPLPFLPSRMLLQLMRRFRFCHQGVRFHLYLEIGFFAFFLLNSLHPCCVQTADQGFHKRHLFPRVLHYRQWILQWFVHYRQWATIWATKYDLPCPTEIKYCRIYLGRAAHEVWRKDHWEVWCVHLCDWDNVLGCEHLQEPDQIIINRSRVKNYL